MKIKCLAPLIALILVACDSPPPPNFAPLSFKGRTPIYLDVVNIELHNEYKAPLKAPNVEHKFPVTPEQAITAWVNDRLKTAGSNKTLVVKIKNASVIEEKLPTQQGFSGMFKDEQAYKYTANVSLELRIYGDSPISIADTEVNASRFATLSEGATLVERDQLYYDLTKALMEDLNAELDKNINQYFANYIHYNR